MTELVKYGQKHENKLHCLHILHVFFTFLDACKIDVGVQFNYTSLETGRFGTITALSVRISSLSLMQIIFKV